MQKKPTMDNEKFIEAYDAYADAIFRHCYYRLSNHEQAKDIMQDAFMKTWNYIAKGNTVENIRAFLFKVANNLIVDYVRKKKDISLDELQEQGFDPGLDETERTQRQIDSRAILAVVEQLDQKYRDVVLMRFIDEFSPKEIAEILGEKENAVSVRIHRGLAQLRKLINTT
jgi:RNA polymerase sigma-70 factor, ECF subfamily